MSDNPDPKEFIGQYKQDIVAYVDALVEQDHRERYGKSRHLQQQMTANRSPSRKGI